MHGGAPAAGEVAWLAKPPGTSYAEFHSELAERAAWQRQMTLGPAGEYVVEGADLPWSAVAVRREEV